MNQLEIEQYLEEKIKNLDQKVQDKFCYIFDDGDGIHGKMIHFANCNRIFKPPVITFYTKVLQDNNFKENNLDGLVNHEIIHAFGFGELSAHEGENIKDFTKKHEKSIS